MSRTKEKIFSNRYRIIDQLGSGGMAQVYKAEDTILNRTVALKLLHPRLASQNNFVERLRREAQAAANLNHPNIVNIYDWGNQNSTYYIVMEYLKGESLNAIVEREAPLAIGRALKIAAQVCDALQFAHDHDVVHRDIKPHNIIINDKGAVRVTDFGIARAGSAAGVTQTGSVIGTAKYVSPEQAQGGFVGHTSDIYSLGVVLYEMTTGQVPFEGDSAVAVAYKHVHEEPPRPRRFNPNISPELESLILKALEKDPAKRFATASEMKQGIEGLLGDHAAEALPESSTKPIRPVRKDRPPQKKNMTWVAIGAVLLLAVAIAAYAALSGPARIVVPDFSGKTLAQAQSLAKKSGLAIEVSDKKESSEVEAGYIMDQDPGAGEKVEEKGTVSVIVSEGKAKIAVPEVLGKSSEDASFILGQASLEIGDIERKYSEDVPEGQVMSQDPAAGTKVPESAVVNLIVSLGEETIDVPDLRGKTRGEVETILDQIGFKVELVESYSDTIPKESVLDQNPQPGQKVKKDSLITVTISLGAEIITAPSVIGLSEEDAKTTLTNAGLKYSIVERTSEADAGKVLDQYPKPDREIKVGSTVTLYVGKSASDDGSGDVAPPGGQLP